MNGWLLAGFALVLAWIGFALLAAWPSGWVHLPLAIGVVLIAVGIVRSDQEGDSAR